MCQSIWLADFAPDPALEMCQSRLSDAEDLAGPGTHDDQTVPHRRGGLDTATEVHPPQLGRVDGRVAHVVGVQPAPAVALDPDVVDDHRRRPRRPRQLLGPADLAGVGVDTEDLAGVGRDDQQVAVQPRRGPHPGIEARTFLDAPHQRIVGARRVELDDLADLVGPGRPSLVLDTGVDHPLLVDDQAGVDVVTGPEAEDPLRLDALVEVGDVPPLDQPARVGEVEGVAADRHGVLDRDVAADGGHELVVPPGGVEDDLGIDRDQPVGSVPPVQLHDVDLGVLTALEQVVVDHQPGPVPVVVPLGRGHIEGPEAPELGRLISVEGEDAVVVVPAPYVGERVSIGIDRDRALDDVAGVEVGQEALTAVGVEEVDVGAVGTERDPRRVVTLEDGGLTCPSRSAPGLGFPADGRHRAHRSGPGELPHDPGVGRYRSRSVVGAGRVAPEREQTLDGVPPRLADRRWIDPPVEGRKGGRGRGGGRRRGGRRRSGGRRRGQRRQFGRRRLAVVGGRRDRNRDDQQDGDDGQEADGQACVSRVSVGHRRDATGGRSAEWRRPRPHLSDQQALLALDLAFAGHVAAEGPPQQRRRCGLQLRDLVGVNVPARNPHRPARVGGAPRRAVHPGSRRRPRLGGRRRKPVDQLPALGCLGPLHVIGAEPDSVPLPGRIVEGQQFRDAVGSVQ